MRLVKMREVLVLLLVLTFFACSKKEELSTTIRPVATVEVQEPGVTYKKTFSGISKADDEIDLSFRLSGNIEEIFVGTGDKVKKGELIAKLESTDQQLEVNKAQANIAEVNAKLKQAKSEFERSILLYEADNISKSELDSQEAAYLSTKAQLEASMKNLSLAQQKLNYCQIYSPSTGVISSVPPSSHQVISAGEVVATLQVDGPIEVEFGVPESMINSFVLGQNANVKFEFLEKQNFTAKVTEIGVSPDETTTFPVKVSLVKGDKRIRPGMVCDLEFEFKNAVEDRFITLPSSSVVGDVSGENYVWLYDEASSTVVKRSVKIGRLDSDGVMILEGLSGGEIVVTKGANTVVEGMKVKLI